MRLWCSEQIVVLQERRASAEVAARECRQGMETEMRTVHGVDELLKKMSARWAPAIEPSPFPPSKPSAGMKLQEYEEGVSVDGVAVLRKRGLNIGSTVVRKGANLLLTIADVSRDSAVAHPATGFVVHLAGAQDGITSTIKVPMSVFLETYEAKSSAEVAQRHEGWPAKEPKASALYHIHTAKCQLSYALALCGGREAPDIFIETKPSRTVKVVRTAAKGSLMLVPETLKISHASASEDMPHNAVAIDIKPRHELIADVRFYLSPTFTDDFVCPAWAVKTVSDAAKANVEWTQVEVSSVTVCAWPEQRTRIVEKSGGTWKSLECKATIPVLTNTTAIDAGQELLLFQALAPKKQKAAPITAASLMLPKKAKTQE